MCLCVLLMLNHASTAFILANLRNVAPAGIRSKISVVLERTARDIAGTSCLVLEEDELRHPQEDRRLIDRRGTTSGSFDIRSSAWSSAKLMAMESVADGRLYDVGFL